MIRVVVDVDADGGLRGLEVTGHAGISETGVSVVCGAVSALVRSAARLLMDTPGVAVVGEAPEAGVLRVAVASAESDRRGFLVGMTALLIQGIRDIAREAPEEVALEIADARESGSQNDRQTKESEDR